MVFGTCFSVHLRIGEPPPISAYFSRMLGVLRLAMRGPRKLHGGQKRRQFDSHSFFLLLKRQFDDVAIHEEVVQEAAHLVQRARPSHIQLANSNSTKRIRSSVIQSWKCCS